MGFKRDVNEKLARIEQKLTEYVNVLKVKDRIIDLQKELISDLREEKKDLMNRIMAVDYEKLRVFELGKGEPGMGEEPPWDADESLVGDVVEGREPSEGEVS